MYLLLALINLSLEPSSDLQKLILGWISRRRKGEGKMYREGEEGCRGGRWGLSGPEQDNGEGAVGSGVGKRRGDCWDRRSRGMVEVAVGVDGGRGL
ncbi:hypothetical protein C4D60_Mb10t01070 [Musa balbisiana]|uniref:Uncharacterized protein n=1 Tax=Musa balbisiana TaxID=52838 RepID=A0A4S8ITX3_MUSBA|nr:hypothetical protein C4D60_Mb10t01070 [Musa balbisiana]